MLIRSVLLESYEIPTFYEGLESFGIKSIQPEKNEIYRGDYNQSKILIKGNGQVYHSNIKFYQEIIDLIMEKIEKTEINEIDRKRKTNYMILARPSNSTYDNHPVNHLNLWLNKEQYNHAKSLFLEDNNFKEMSPLSQFEDVRFKIGKKIIRFHHNGKVIAEDGYAQFAYYLSEAIREDLPYDDYDLIIGQDEVGVGEYIGPLVVGSVISTPDQLIDLQLVGVKDSKMIPRGITLNMQDWVRQISTFSMTERLSPIDFNLLKYDNDLSTSQIISNMHELNAKNTIRFLNRKKYRDKKMIYIIDQFDQYEKVKLLQELHELDIEVKYFPHAEQKSIAVAAASVIARANRLKWIRINEKISGLELKRKNLEIIRKSGKNHDLIKMI